MLVLSTYEQEILTYMTVPWGSYIISMRTLTLWRPFWSALNSHLDRIVVPQAVVPVPVLLGTMACRFLHREPSWSTVLTPSTQEGFFRFDQHGVTFPLCPRPYSSSPSRNLIPSVVVHGTSHILSWGFSLSSSQLPFSPFYHVQIIVYNKLRDGWRLYHCRLSDADMACYLDFCLVWPLSCLSSLQKSTAPNASPNPTIFTILAPFVYLERESPVDGKPHLRTPYFLYR